MVKNPRKLKALIFDIDGTLLTSQGTMSETTYAALYTCYRKGFLISVATARAGKIVFRKQDIAWDYQFLLDRAIVYNGATIFDKKKCFYQHIAISDCIVSQVVSCIENYDNTLQIVLQHDDQYHSFKYPLPDQYFEEWGLIRSEMIDFSCARLKPTTKIMIFNATEFPRIPIDLCKLYEIIKTSFSDELDIILSDSKTYLYVLSKQVNKARAISTLIALNDIKPHEVAVFGDDRGDLSMFGFFGVSIAMNNAHESVKRRATFITKSNDDEGVVFALKKYLKIL